MYNRIPPLTKNELREPDTEISKCEFLINLKNNSCNMLKMHLFIVYLWRLHGEQLAYAWIFSGRRKNLITSCAVTNA